MTMQPVERRKASYSANSQWIVQGTVLIMSALLLGASVDHSALTGIDDVAMGNAAWLNRFALFVCLVTVLKSVGRPSSRGIIRVFKSPVLWIVAYQLIISAHRLNDGLFWDEARLTGGWFLLVLAMSASPPMAAEDYLAGIRMIFRVLLLLAIAAAFVNPLAALQQDYSGGILPWTTVRFAGIAATPNGMGALAGVAFLLEASKLAKTRRLLGWAAVFVVIALGELILAQAKTTMAGCAMAGSYLLASELGRRQSLLVRTVLAVSFGVAIVWTTLTLLGFWIAENAEAIETVTGRTTVWRVFWEMALQKPWFGYGPGLWIVLQNDVMFPYKFAAGNAHLQPLNCFLMAGLFGVLCWLCYVVALIRQSRTVDPSCRPIYNAILLLLLVRCLTDMALEPGDYFIVGQMQMILIGILFCREKRKLKRAGPVRSYQLTTRLAKRPVPVHV